MVVSQSQYSESIVTLTREASLATSADIERHVKLLQDFISQYPDSREARKAFVVKLVYQGYLYDEIQELLEVSRGSISGWKQAYDKYGIDGLKLHKKGRKGYLNCQQREQVIRWLQSKDCWELGELENKLASEYDIVYKSKQSYYNLFDAASVNLTKIVNWHQQISPNTFKQNKINLKSQYENQSLVS